MPEGWRIRRTAFYTFLVLVLGLGSAALATARFGPWRGTFLDLHVPSSGGFINAVMVAWLASAAGFWLSWLASPELRYRHRFLGIFIVVMSLVILALPG